ncbi:sporulation protein YpjB [Paenibacillus oryzisoli]|uniref:sporulation protein YpjB n=1 Tax=Paenibacillus oryzisoli TaxID=1850517 RepID=UPI003D29F4DB
MNWTQKRRSAGLLLCLAFIISVFTACGAAVQTNGQALKPADPVQQERIAYLDGLAGVMYNLTMDGQVVEARDKLLQIAQMIPTIRFEGITTVAGMNALTETVTGAELVFNNIKYSPEVGQVAAAKIRLAIDALSHKNQPMWLQYYKVLQNDVSQLSMAVKANKQGEAQQALGKLAQHVDIVHPSLVISRDETAVTQLDSLLAFIHTNVTATPMKTNELTSGLEQLNRVLDELFMKHKDAIAVVPLMDPKQPILWTLGMGLIIVSVLSYVGWRMYQTGRNIVSVKSKAAGEIEK